MINTKRSYLNELNEVKEKYMINDFPKYLSECKKIEKRYEHYLSLYPSSMRKGVQTK